MGIVAAPCIGPFVLALLVHVGTKGDPVYGFFMFFVLAIGLGLPYLLLGTFSGALKRLPRSGEWMVTVRKVFGLVLIGMALYFLMPLLGQYTTLVFVTFFAASALYLIFWESGRTRQKKFAWVLRSLGAGAAVIAVAMAVPKKTEAEISWQPFSEERLAAALKEGKPVIIDAYADWCIPCKELDKLTFTDSDVKKEAEAKFVSLKLDLTKSNDASEAARAREKFDILGVPTIIFIEPTGRERADLRLEGFEKPGPFLERMKKVEATAPAPVDVEDGIGKPVPDVSVKLLDGSMLDLKATRGKVVLIDFWATWCIPCLAEIPIFNALDKSYKSQGVEIIAISLDEEGAEVVKPFLKAHPMSYTVALGDFKLAEMFGVDDSIPVTIVVDKQGRMRFRHVGVTGKDKFESEIKALLQE
jgi:thiol:disulfide interchange protein